MLRVTRIPNGPVVLLGLGLRLARSLPLLGLILVAALLFALLHEPVAVDLLEHGAQGVLQAVEPLLRIRELQELGAREEVLKPLRVLAQADLALFVALHQEADEPGLLLLAGVLVVPGLGDVGEVDQCDPGLVLEEPVHRVGRCLFRESFALRGAGRPEDVLLLLALLHLLEVLVLRLDPLDASLEDIPEEAHILVHRVRHLSAVVEGVPGEHRDVDEPGFLLADDVIHPPRDVADRRQCRDLLAVGLDPHETAISDGGRGVGHRKGERLAEFASEELLHREGRIAHLGDVDHHLAIVIARRLASLFGLVEEDRCDPLRVLAGHAVDATQELDDGRRELGSGLHFREEPQTGEGRESALAVLKRAGDEREQRPPCGGNMLHHRERIALVSRLLGDLRSGVQTLFDGRRDLVEFLVVLFEVDRVAVHALPETLGVVAHCGRHSVDPAPQFRGLFQPRFGPFDLAEARETQLLLDPRLRRRLLRDLRLLCRSVEALLEVPEIRLLGLGFRLGLFARARLLALHNASRKKKSAIQRPYPSTKLTEKIR